MACIPMEFIIVNDDEDNYYIIPSSMGKAFENWINSEDWDTPVWAVHINSPHEVVFTSYRLEEQNV